MTISNAATAQAAVTNLLPQDLQMFTQLGISAGLLEQAGVRRVSDAEARDVLGLNGARGDMAGILYSYFSPQTHFRVGGRVRRDNPEVEDGKPKNKYMSGYGDRPHLYFVPGYEALLADLTTPVILLEAEKSALAVAAWSERTGKRIIPVAMGGCWGWRGRIGKVENSKGFRVDETGPSADLSWCARRRAYILLDANCKTNPKVKGARRELAAALRNVGADVRILDLPAVESVNGPDDFLAAQGDAAFSSLLETGVIASKDGTTRSLLANAIALLRESPDWSGVLAYNEFTLYVTTKKSAPWQKRVGANWTDYDDTRTTEWLQRHDVLVNTSIAAEAVQAVAKENPFHPIRDYLQGLVWDRLPRLDAWLVNYLGVADFSYVRAVGARWMISAVARIFEPGCQADYTLLLLGTQGRQKSTALRILTGDEWFSDHISELGSKDSRIELHGRWIIEFSELASILHRRGELEATKAFLTTRIDHFRMPYGRRNEAVPRTNVFAATINSDTPFNDPTGNRRFWPVECGHIDIPALKRDRDQLWAEAYARYCNGQVWWLDTKELNDAAEAEQERRYEPGIWDDLIRPWLDEPTRNMQLENETAIPRMVSTSDRVTVNDILCHCVGKAPDRQTQADMNQVARFLAHEKWTRKQERKGPDRGK